jgi:hypothetical protein
VFRRVQAFFLAFQCNGAMVASIVHTNHAYASYPTQKQLSRWYLAYIESPS